MRDSMSSLDEVKIIVPFFGLGILNKTVWHVSVCILQTSCLILSFSFPFNCLCVVSLDLVKNF